MFDRLLRDTPPEARARLLTVLGVTTWGAAITALVAGWPFGAAWLAVGAVVFSILRNRAAIPTNSLPPSSLVKETEASIATATSIASEASAVPKPSAPVDPVADPEESPALAALENRVLARLHHMATTDDESATLADSVESAD
jgi:hypothetical protein